MKTTAKTLIIALFLLISTLSVQAANCCANPGAGVQNFCSTTQDVIQSTCCPSSGYSGVGPTSQTDCQNNYYSASQNCNVFEKCETGCCCNPFNAFGRRAECSAGQFYSIADLGSQTCQQKCAAQPPGGGAGGGGAGGGGAACTDVDGDGYGAVWTTSCPKQGVDCVDNNININPGAAEICGNTIDEDCSGADAVCGSGGCKDEPFSVFKDKPSCENSKAGICFYDKSQTAANDCYECDPRMECYDYKSRGACETNNCQVEGGGAGKCGWADTYAEQGYGVCKSNARNLCLWCPKQGTTDPFSSTNKVMDTYDVFNPVYEAPCNDLRKTALSTAQFNCKTAGATCTDNDGDGYGAGCAKGPDCDDSNAAVHPFAPEICGNGINEDCSAGDLPCAQNCVDNDKDTYGVGSGCAGADCNDNNPAIHPGAQEICGNGINEDCAAGDLPCAPSTCTDNDRDTYGTGTGCTGPDCNDNNVNVHPGATEVCGNGIDDDCSGGDLSCTVVQGCTDVDGDGYGTAGSTNCPRTGIDCDDNNPNRNPGKTEICSNGIDEDCFAGDKNPDWHCSQWSACVNNQHTCTGMWTDRNGCGLQNPGSTSLPCTSSPPGPGAECVAITADPPTNPVVGSRVTFDAVSAYNYQSPILALGSGGRIDSGPSTYTPAVAAFGWRWQTTVTSVSGSYTATFSSTKDGQQCSGTAGFNVVSGAGSCSNSNCGVCSSQSSCQSANCNWCSGNICQSQSCPGGPPPAPTCTDNDRDGYGTAGSTGCQKTGIDCDDNNAGIKPEGDESLCDGIDNNCDGIRDNVPFGCPMEITLTKPRLGASNVTPFDVEINTERMAVCKHRAFDAAFSAMHSFPITSEDKRTHTQPGYSIQSSPENFFVKCNDTSRPSNNVTNKTFELTFDATRPVIIRAYAFPEVIADIPLEARLFAETDDKTWCKYGVGKTYEELQFRFSRYSEDNASAYATVNSAELRNLVDNTRYRYNISCKNLVGLTSSLAEVSFLVNTSAPAELTIVNPENGLKTANRSLKINTRTNKRALCFFGNTSEAASFSGSFGTETTTHESDLVNFAHGGNTVHVKCSFATSQGLVIKSASSIFIVDLTPPSKPAINDDSGLADPEKTSRKDMLTARFKAEDPETGIAFYNYTIFTIRGISEEYIINWTKTNEERANARNLNLTEGKTYYFKAFAQNNAGVWGLENESNGITFDSSSRPETCGNNRTDIGETGKDCGGNCSGCGEGMKCNSTADCLGNLFCNASRQCAIATCSDGIKNQDETGTDCGGELCNPCGEKGGCLFDSDCLSGECSLDGKCTAPGTCSNGKLDKDESDVDCGLSCADNFNKKCDGGKKCKGNLDCTSGKCNFGICGYIDDRDNDNISNSKDNCPDDYNPKQEDSDKDNIGDKCDLDLDNDGMNDECEITYFNSTNCEDEKKCGPNADPDKDGLTNKEECKEKPFTNPLKKDSDGDGFSDKEELDKGTDPNDPNSHPSRFSFFKFMLWILLLILIAAGAIFGYKYYKKRKEEKESKRVPKQFMEMPPIRPLGKPISKVPLRELTLREQLMIKKKRNEEEAKKRTKLFDVFVVKKEKTEGSQQRKEEIPKPETPEIPTIVPVQEPLYPEREDVYRKLAQITKKKPKKPFKALPKKTKPKLSRTKKKS